METDVDIYEAGPLMLVQLFVERFMIFEWGDVMLHLEGLASDSWDQRKGTYDQLAINDMNRATRSQAKALYQYTLSHDINLFIKRCAKEDLDVSKELARDPKNPIGGWIDDIDTFLEQGESLPCDIMLYKGVIRKDLNRLFTVERLRSEDFSEVKGKTFLEYAYMSTTINKDYAFESIKKNRKFYHEEDSKELDALFLVHVSEGHKVSAVDKMSQLFSARENIQHEILLPRAQSFVVQDIRKCIKDDMSYLCFDICIS